MFALATCSSVTPHIAIHSLKTPRVMQTARGARGVGFQSVLLNFLPAPKKIKCKDGVSGMWSWACSMRMQRRMDLYFSY